MTFFSQNHIRSPLQRLNDERLEAHNIRLFIKRDDQLHPFPKESGFRTSTVSGNKFRKLKHNLAEMQRLSNVGLITFGGAFSNHIHATAAAGQLLNLPTIGIIRGERPPVLSPTLVFAESCGMALQFISRSDYRDKDLIFKNLAQQYPNYYWLPEGGTNAFAMLGAAEVVPEIIDDLGAQPDYICLACGTGGTIAGIVSAAATLPKPISVIGFSALKGDFLENDVFELLKQYKNAFYTVRRTPFGEGGERISDLGFRISDLSASNRNWAIQTDYHFGGYAKWAPPLIDFINDFKQKHAVALDPVYTGKMLFGVFDLIERGFFPKNTTIVAVHTGGLQGIEGFNQRFGRLITT